MDIELFNEFLFDACDLEDWDRDVYPSVWLRHNSIREVLTWSPIAEGPDPYDLIEVFVAAGIEEGFESMLLMYGSMVKIDENDDNDEETRTSVRVMIYFDGDTPTVAVQPEGSTAWFPDDAGEGMMPETLTAVIERYKNGELLNG